jgi:hypothetical protein
LGSFLSTQNIRTVAEIYVRSYNLVLELEAQTLLVGRGGVTYPMPKSSQTYLSATAELGPRSSNFKGLFNRKIRIRGLPRLRKNSQGCSTQPYPVLGVFVRGRSFLELDSESAPTEITRRLKKIMLTIIWGGGEVIRTTPKKRARALPFVLARWRQKSLEQEKVGHVRLANA